MHLNQVVDSIESPYQAETVFACIHDKLITVIEPSHVTGICLLDLSVAFDRSTTDNTIFLERLSLWFGKSDTVNDWLRSYLRTWFFQVSYLGQSSSYTIDHGVPHGFVLGPCMIAFMIYATYTARHRYQNCLYQIVHSKWLDYCNSLKYDLPKTSMQSIRNTLARSITNGTKFCHISPMLKSLHWLKTAKSIHQINS